MSQSQEYVSIEVRPEHADFLTRVSRELERARQVNPKDMNSFHEGYAVLLEEVEEFWDEVKKKRQKRDPAKMLEELVQVAAMTMRIVLDRGLLP